MRLLGIKISPPEPRELLGATLFITGFVVLGLVLEHFGFVERDKMLPTTLAFSMGVILNIFGVSLFRHGLRAWIIFVAAALMFVAAWNALGFIP
jgi:hypothetical protein